MRKYKMSKKVLFCLIGAQGSIGTTIATGLCLHKSYPHKVEKYLTTNKEKIPAMECIEEMECCGWDLAGNSFSKSFERNTPFKEKIFQEFQKDLDQKTIYDAPDYNLPVSEQVKLIKENIKSLKNTFKDYSFVAVNILPASNIDYEKCSSLSLDEIYKLSGKTYQDLSYLIACLEEGVSFVNFTPNPIELPAIVELAQVNNCCICGRDGKTGQTYWKVVIASAMSARNLLVDGWYSTNILGNDDGLALNVPGQALNKIKQKSDVLNKAVGYEVKNHIVRIDYYPPRKDNKEAYDVIDFVGFLDEEMSMRISLLAKDSVLAAPMIIDLARWCVYLNKEKNRNGIISELAFFFKAPLEDVKRGRFQDQLLYLDTLCK
jgi:myo-inositol-1-phosphate synthase